MFGTKKKPNVNIKQVQPENPNAAQEKTMELMIPKHSKHHKNKKKKHQTDETSNN